MLTHSRISENLSSWFLPEFLKEISAMVTNPQTEQTTFSRDVFGRYICNGLDEAMRSADRSLRADARPFDIIILGGGTFGSVLAQHLFDQDKSRNHRILVLEAGPLLLAEHVQNLPLMGLSIPGATSIADLRQQGQDGAARAEVWGLPWHSSVKFPGLAYCVGGRSLYWGGWSPEPLDAETPGTHWPASVINDLRKKEHGYLQQAKDQIGVSETNDFIFGALHDRLREHIYDGIIAGKISSVVPLNSLPLQVSLPGRINGKEREMMKLEAPLAVQTRTRSGFFPFNKFSAVPLLTKAVRSAWIDSGNDDVKKDLMVTPNCHVVRLVTQGDRVTAIETNQGSIPVPENSAVIMALGTIETTRLAQASFGQLPNAHLMGRNLMAHLRSNLNLRIPRMALAMNPAIREMQASALFVKGMHTHADGSRGHFHIQISAAGLGAMDVNSEAELFKKVPDLDQYESIMNASDTHVVITLRGIGEMQPDNDLSRISIDNEPDEFGVQRSLVNINPSANDLDLWETMDLTCDDLAMLLANGGPYEILSPNGPIHLLDGRSPRTVLSHEARRDGLGTTHHEAGTLRMGDNPETSVTNANGRFHQVQNTYALGPVLCPSVGSVNPMLTGVALARRMAEHLIPDPVPFQAESGFKTLFDGIHMDQWRMVGQGNFIVLDGNLECVPGNDIGLLWHQDPVPRNFMLRLQWKRCHAEDNSGVFLRFPDPTARQYLNPAYVAVQSGFEVQIDERGMPDGADYHRTGAIYGVAAQQLSLQTARSVGEWNEFEIRVQGQVYTVIMNGLQVAEYKNTDSQRGVAAQESFVGLQAYPGSRIAFRRIRIKPL